MRPDSRFLVWILATVLVVGTVAGAKFAGAQGAAFGLFGTLTLGSAVLCLLERSTLRSAIALLSTLLGTAGLFLLLESDFLAMTQILVCVGGVLAMILLGAISWPVESEQRSLARVFGALLLIVPLCAWFAWKSGYVDALAVRAASAPDDVATWILRGNALPDTNPAGESGALAVALIDPKRYVVAFEMAALLIVVASIAALCVARKPEDES